MAQQGKEKIQRFRSTSMGRNNGRRPKEDPQKTIEMEITTNRQRFQLPVERFRFHPQKYNQLF